MGAVTNDIFASRGNTLGAQLSEALYNEKKRFCASDYLSSEEEISQITADALREYRKHRFYYLKTHIHTGEIISTIAHQLAGDFLDADTSFQLAISTFKQTLTGTDDEWRLKYQLTIHMQTTVRSAILPHITTVLSRKIKRDRFIYQIMERMRWRPEERLFARAIG